MKEEKQEILKIKKVASFECGIWQNVIDITMALAKAGRFVNIVRNGDSWVVHIYSR